MVKSDYNKTSLQNREVDVSILTIVTADTQQTKEVTFGFVSVKVSAGLVWYVTVRRRLGAFGE